MKPGYLGARVSRTYGLFEDRPDDDRLFDATVGIYENDVLLHELDSINLLEVNYFKTIYDPFGGIGRTFELRVSHPDYPSVSAFQTMPEPIPLINTEFRKLETGSISNFNAEFRLTFDDPPGEENFYELVAAQNCYYEYENYYGEIMVDSFQQSVYFDMETSTDPNITQGYNYDAILVSDQNFDGQTFTLSPKFWTYNCSYPETEDDASYIIFWRTVTKDYFNYSKSLLDSSNAADNPFAEPVSLYTNMEGGVGAFCLRSELIYTVE